jgi:hypothetical protein
MAVEAHTINEDRLNAFLGQVLGELGATVNAGLIVIGDRLGLYRAMDGAGPITPAEIAERTGTTERYVREWLNAQAAGGYVTYDAKTRRYELPPEQALRRRCARRPKFAAPSRAAPALAGTSTMPASMRDAKGSSALATT